MLNKPKYMKYTFIIFGLAEWDALLPTNQHHLARHLAERGHEVLFVDTVGTRRPRLGWADAGRVVRRLMGQNKAPRQVEEGIWRISPLGPVPGIGAMQRKVLERRYASAVTKAIAQLGWPNPIGWFFNPRAAFLLGKIPLPMIVYHAVDDLRQIPGADITAIEEGEQHLARAADLVLSSAPPLYERLTAMAPGKTHLLPNVADFEHFHAAARDKPDAAIDSLPHPRIVFSGNLAASKIDVPLLLQLVRQRADWHWVFIGLRWEGEVDEGLGQLSSLPNAHFIGHVAYKNLPRHFAGADAFIIPYASNELTASVCPLKFFEYLATGKPVVATPLPALLPFANVVPLANNFETFVAALNDVLRHPEEKQAERLALARSYTWDRRIEEIETLLEGLNKHP